MHAVMEEGDLATALWASNQAAGETLMGLIAAVRERQSREKERWRKKGREALKCH